MEILLVDDLLSEAEWALEKLATSQFLTICPRVEDMVAAMNLLNKAGLSVRVSIPI